MFPDLGLYLVEQGQQEPFELAVFNHLMLGEDRVLGWLINGVTHQFRTSGLEKRPAPIIPEPMMFSIYLGRGSKTRTSKIVERLRTEGLVAQKEEKIMKLIKRAKLFRFLREIRHLLFDEAFQEELSQMYAEVATGHPPVPPAQLALTVILQAYTKAEDAEAIEALTMARRWQLVVDCRGL